MEENFIGRTFAIGDIHGMLDKLDYIIEKISPTINDKLIFLGDYIDRGPNSKEVVDYLIKLSKNIDCIFLTGNHEVMLKDFLTAKNEIGYYTDIYLNNGGDSTCRSYLKHRQIKLTNIYFNDLQKEIEKHSEFYDKLKWYYEDDKYIYVHGGVRKDIEMVDQDNLDLVWMREEFIENPTGFDKKIIFGHTPRLQPTIMNDKIGIDTGAYYKKGVLTAICLPNETFIQSF